MNRLQANPRICATPLVLAAMALVVLAACKTWAQSAGSPAGTKAQSPQSQAAPPQPGAPAPAAPSDDLAQMRTDLDRMESLLGNMSSETEFLRDQNLQILLRTNAQIWTILIRDLRRQVDREERATRQTH